jgi:hypothetical protein
MASEHIADLVTKVEELAKGDAAILVLEGDTDASVLQATLGAAEFFIAGGRNDALGVAKEIPGSPALAKSAVVVVDADFDRITGKVTEYHDQLHVIFTDAHDMEVMIISVEEVRRRVLTTVLRCSLVESIGIWTQALALEVEVALARLVSHLQGWNVRLGGLDRERVLGADGEVNRGRLAAEFTSRLRAGGVDIGPGELIQLMSSEEVAAAEWSQLVNGHDLCKSLTWFARRSIGASTSGREIESALRVAFQTSHLSTSRLADRIRTWCLATGRAALI